jgi:hypothetical protein
MKLTLLRSLAILPLFSALAVLPTGCAAEDAGTADDEEDLTSITARSRTLSFEGIVYVEVGASDGVILAAAQQQTRTAFGAFREADIAVNNRELKAIDTKTFKKRAITVVDTDAVADAGRPLLEVRYTYTDDAVVAPSYARRSTTNSALLSERQVAERERVLTECTANDSDARSFPLWYGFNPGLSKCETAMKKEDALVRADRIKLGAGAENKITKSEANRLYFPITVKLGADKTAKGNTYPEYDRLYTGGITPNTLSVGLVYGMIDHHTPEGGPQEDSGYGEWVDNLNELFKVRDFNFVSIDAPEGIESATLASGKKVTGLTLPKILGWHNGDNVGLEGLSSSEESELKKIMGQRVYRHWITLESKAKVKIGSAAEKDFTYKIITYFGAESEEAPHRFGIKNSDVYIYNGHSYIGSGPLDPTRYTAADFPKSYQIFFIDGCVSYNYYHKGYIPLKEGGTKNLDLITNGLESPSWRSGYATGRLVATMINGKGASYKEMLAVSSDTDRLRVVDGELDNKWRPTKTPIVVK